jgi:hypothetical protein
MATQAIESVPSGEDAGASTEAAPAKASGKRTVLILAIAGFAAGSAAGLFGIAPLLTKAKPRRSRRTRPMVSSPRRP